MGASDECFRVFSFLIRTCCERLTSSISYTLAFSQTLRAALFGHIFSPFNHAGPLLIAHTSGQRASMCQRVFGVWCVWCVWLLCFRLSSQECIKRLTFFLRCCSPSQPHSQPHSRASCSPTRDDPRSSRVFALPAAGRERVGERVGESILFADVVAQKCNTKSRGRMSRSVECRARRKLLRFPARCSAKQTRASLLSCPGAQKRANIAKWVDECMWASCVFKINMPRSQLRY